MAYQHVGRPSQPMTPDDAAHRDIGHPPIEDVPPCAEAAETLYSPPNRNGDNGIGSPPQPPLHLGPVVGDEQFTTLKNQEHQRRASKSTNKSRPRQQNESSCPNWTAWLFTVLVTLCALGYAATLLLAPLATLTGSTALETIHLIAASVGSSALLALIGVYAVVSGGRYWRLCEVSEVRDRLEEFRSGEPLDHKQKSRLLKLLRKRNAIELPAALSKAFSKQCDAKQVIDRFEQERLVPVDRKADKIIFDNALGVALGTAAASAAFDVLIVLWRTLATINQIAALYGGRPGVFGTLLLLRRSMYSITVAGIADHVSNAVAGSVLNNRGLAMIFGRLGQGLGNGVMLMRLGYAAKSECRLLRAQDTDTLLGQVKRLKNCLNRAKAEAETSAAASASAVA